MWAVFVGFVHCFAPVLKIMAQIVFYLQLQRHWRNVEMSCQAVCKDYLYSRTRS